MAPHQKRQNKWENIGDNYFHLKLSTYMKMYSVVNIENLKLYEPYLSWTLKRLDRFSPWTNLHPNTWTRYQRISFLIVELGIDNRETWITFILVSRECIQVRHVGLKRRK